MKVLLGFDGSPQAERARDLAASLEWPAGTTIRVVSAHEATEIFVDRLLEYSVGELEAELERATRSLVAPERSIETAVIVGRPADVLVDEARRIGADLVVVGSRGRGAIETMLLGSVAAEVVDRAPCPVLVARGERIRSTVLAEDGSVAAREARRLIEAWRPLLGTRVQVVSVLHVRPPFSSGVSPTIHAAAVAAHAEMLVKARSEHERLAARVAKQLKRADLAADAQVREGDPAEQILVLARETAADLIVVGTRGRRGLARAVLGSVARNVLVHAPCSVLVVRKVGRRAREPERPDSASASSAPTV